MNPFQNPEEDLLFQEMDSEARKAESTWGQVIPPVDPAKNPFMKKHEEDLRRAHGYVQQADGSWVLPTHLTPPSQKVFGNEPRGQVEVPPYSIQQGRAPGPHGMEQHQGGRVLGVSEDMREKREIEEQIREEKRKRALGMAERTQPSRFEGDVQTDGYAWVVNPRGQKERRHVKSPEYRRAVLGENGWSMPDTERTRARVPDPVIPPGQDMRNIPPGRRDEARELDAANPVPAPAPPAGPRQVPDAPPGMIRDTDVPGTQFVNAPGEGAEIDGRPVPTNDTYPDALPPSGEFPNPPSSWRDLHWLNGNDLNINPDTGMRWAGNDEQREWYWKNRAQFKDNPRLGQRRDDHGGIVDEDGNPVPGMNPRGDLDNLLGPFGQRRGVNNPPPQGPPLRPENWWAFPDAPRPPGAPPMMRERGAPPQQGAPPPGLTPPPGMMYGNRQAPPGMQPDPNVAVPGYTPGIDSREYPPFDPNMPFGYQQPAQEWTDTISGQAQRRGKRGQPPRTSDVPFFNQSRADRRSGKREEQAAEQERQAAEVAAEEAAREALTEENRLLEESIPHAALTPEGNLRVHQRIRVGEGGVDDPTIRAGGDDPTVPGLPHQSSKLKASKLRGEEQAAAIENLIISGEEQYLIDHGILSSGEIAQLKVELIREGRIGSTYPGQTPAQRVLSAAAGGPNSAPVGSIEGGLEEATRPTNADTSGQLRLLQRIANARRAKVADKQAAKQVRRENRQQRRQ